MTKDTYFEMCEMLGTEPVEAEIPLELSDFPDLVQQSFVIYNILSDTWDSMGGNYLGKDYSIVFKLFEVYRIETNTEKLISLELMQHIDRVRSDIISEKIKAKSPQR